MKNLFLQVSWIIIVVILSCCTDDGVESSDDYMSESSTSDNGNGEQSGLITAAEWNDLNNWEFWSSLVNGQDFNYLPEYWSIFTNNRISVQLYSDSLPLNNAKVELVRNGTSIWTARTDNFGNAELWIGLFQKENSATNENCVLKVNDKIVDLDLNFIENGINKVSIDTNIVGLNKVELSFIVDATGSMGDELEFLKADLKNVIERVKNDNSDISIFTSTVFYRDEGDDYVVKSSEFTSDINETISFIDQQKASGGGDFPEAVHTALNRCINELQWSTIAKTRVAFLLLDAPPHYENDIIKSIHNTITNAAEKGIKIIPITASGIDKETEFLMRFISIATNGTYVFITDDSGIGNDHLEASVGEYQVEYLNDLMVRLIKKYSD